MAAHALNASGVIDQFCFFIDCLNRAALHAHVALSAFALVDLGARCEEIDHLQHGFAVALFYRAKALWQLEFDQSGNLIIIARKANILQVSFAQIPFLRRFQYRNIRNIHANHLCGDGVQRQRIGADEYLARRIWRPRGRALSLHRKDAVHDMQTDVCSLVDIADDLTEVAGIRRHLMILGLFQPGNATEHIFDCAGKNLCGMGFQLWQVDHDVRVKQWLCDVHRLFAAAFRYDGDHALTVKIFDQRAFFLRDTLVSCYLKALRRGRDSRDCAA